MIHKIRPTTSVEWSDGNDGYDGRYYIAYYCPKCRRKLPGYAMMNACDQCGTFFDWGEREPVIEVARSVRWDGAGVPTAAAYYELEG